MEKAWIYHNSYEEYYRNPFGAVTCDREITLRIAVKCNSKIENILLALKKSKDNTETNLQMNFEENKDNYTIYKVTFKTSINPGLLWYYFIIQVNGDKLFYGNNAKQKGGEGQILNTLPPAYQITVYKKNQTPSWYKEAVFYQIFVDRFHNSCGEGKFLSLKDKSLLHSSWNDSPMYFKNPDGSIKRWNFFGGNLQGIIDKLSYLHDLGINAIYLNPIFEASSNHKYDTGDYKKIDPMFGDEETFRDLCKKANELGINIILDGVFSHTGSDSIYFNKEGSYSEIGAYQSQDSPYYKWFKFSNHPHEYESWWGIGTLPNVHELEPSYVDFIIENDDSVIKHWLKCGAKGWRLDVADEQPDEFIKKIRNAMKEYDPESMLMGEVWEDASNKVSYSELREYFWGDELDSVMNYPFRKTLLEYVLGQKDAENTYIDFMSLFENYPKDIFYSTLNLIGSHDVPRILTLLGDAGTEQNLSDYDKEHYRLNGDQFNLAKKRLKLLTLIQFTFPGMPCIYYGDEVGMEGFSDPYNRGTYPWGKEDYELLTWYKKVIALRKNNKIFINGDWEPVFFNKEVFGYIRKDGEKYAYCIFNRNVWEGSKVKINLKQDGNYINLLNTDEIFNNNNKQIEVLLAPLEGKIISNL
ncbi:alpha-glycosidase [Desulfonispora thiosulfatigenes]|nr:alpha-glycosidase [Desulfonispora thiosulfatigenes]